jgi:hypothetical protein
MKDLLAAACPIFPTCRTARTASRPAREPGVASDPCPSQMTPVNPNRVNADVGGFAGVGGNPVAVTLCRYERDGDGLRLDTARTVRGDVSTVIDAVRALPEPRLNELRTLVARPWYRLAFDLDGRPSESIDIDMNCGLAWSDVDVNGGGLTVPLDAFAELYRAQGGHLDPTPRW